MKPGVSQVLLRTPWPQYGVGCGLLPACDQQPGAGLRDKDDIMKAQASGSRLTHRDTRFVKSMLARGDRQHDIAAYFSVNGARIAEVVSGECEYPNAQPIDEAQLPPPGPYLTKFALQSVIRTLNEAIEMIELAEAEEDVADVKAALMLAKETLQKQIDALEEA